MDFRADSTTLEESSGSSRDGMAAEVKDVDGGLKRMKEISSQGDGESDNWRL